MKEDSEGFLEALEEVLKYYGYSSTIGYALRFFLRNPYESLVIINKSGELEFMDRGSEKLFGLAEGGGKGMDIRKFIPNSALSRVLETGYPAIGRLLQVRNVRKLSSAYPLIKDGEVIGAIGRVLFHSLEELEKSNMKLGRLKHEVRTLREGSGTNIMHCMPLIIFWG